MVLLFSDAAKLSAIQKEWGSLTKVDLLVRGVKKGRYVNAEVTTAKECAAEWIPNMDEEFKTMPYATDLSRFLARTITEDELREAYKKAVNSTDANTGIS